MRAGDRLADFRTTWGRDYFARFNVWSGLPRSAPRMARDIDHYADQFLELEALAERAQTIDQRWLLETFGVEGLRRRQTMLGFLIAETGLAWSEDLARAATAERGIAALMRQALMLGVVNDLRAFDAHLRAAARPVAPRTRRQYLRLALDYARYLAPAPLRSATTRSMRAFLKTRPGQKAAMTAVAAFLKARWGVALTPMRPAPPTPFAQDRALVARVRALWAALEAVPSPARARAVVIALIAALWLTPIATVAALPRSALRQGPEETTLALPDGVFVLDPALATALVAAAGPVAGSWLFPGRVAGRPLGAAAIAYHLDAVLGRRRRRRTPKRSKPPPKAALSPPTAGRG